MAIYRHLVRLPYNTGLPEDIAVNVFHSNSDDVVEAAGFADKLVTFYQAIDGRLSNLLSVTANAASVVTYALADPEPRAPVDTTLFTLAVGANTAPPEVALCMSFQGDKLSGVPQARRRGRVYLGPISHSNIQTDGRPATAMITDIVNAATTLATAAAPGVAGLWAVYSPTTNTAVNVANGWVDNEFDTIRERGRIATSRSLF